jgi:hypothetical protein
MDVKENSSPSFCYFREQLQELSYSYNEDE